MNIQSATRTFLATLAAALAGAATLVMYQQGLQAGVQPAAQQVVTLERVVIEGKRANDGAGRMMLASAPTVVHQLPRVVIEGRSQGASAQQLADAPAPRCVSC